MFDLSISHIVVGDKLFQVLSADGKSWDELATAKSVEDDKPAATLVNGSWVAVEL